MTTLRAELDLSEVRAAIYSLGEKAGPRVIADTVTQLAFDARKAVLTSIPFYMDNPKPFTQSNKAVLVDKASYKASKIEAEVRFAEIQSKYLGRLVFGGGRGSDDPAYTKAGALIPTVNTKLDRYGNFPGGPRRFLSKLDDDPERYQIGIHGRPTYAIWDKGRSGEEFTLIAVFKRAVDYKEQFPFFDLVGNVVEKNAVDVFNQKMQREIDRGL